MVRKAVLALALALVGCAPGSKLPKYVAPQLDKSQAAILSGFGGTNIVIVDNQSVTDWQFYNAFGNKVVLAPGEHAVTARRGIENKVGLSISRDYITVPFHHTFEAGHNYEVGPESRFNPFNVGLVLKDKTANMQYFLGTDGGELGGSPRPVALRDGVSGPTFDDADFEKSAAEVKFDDRGERLSTTDGNPPTGFYLAGTDRVFHPAAAAIVSPDRLVVRSDSVPKPVAVRLIAPTNLVNGRGGPARPFRSDKWTDVPQP